MRVLGFEITRTKAIPPTGLSAPSNRGWWPLVRESFPGAWQRGVEKSRDVVVTFHAVYACVKLISSDISKCSLQLKEKDSDGIWNEVDVPAFSPVLRRPNRFQNRIKFIEQWVVSKLLHGNTYVLKERDARNVVIRLYILDPSRVKPLVATDGSVWYQLSRDNLSGLEQDGIYVPGTEIIHDVMVPLFHPLVGVSPITACGLAAVQGLNIQDHSTRFFSNGARPSGILTAPGAIDDETALRLKNHFEENFSGQNAGRVAVLGDGLEYEAMAMTSEDAQLIEQLKWSAETVCSAFGVPGYKIGVGPTPSYNNVQALDQQYYSQCLQTLIECIELGLDEGLGLDLKPSGRILGTEFDTDDLLRMDSKTLAETEDKLRNIKTPNEARRRLNLPPVEGGDSVYRQQQDFSLEALAKRDAKDDPFATTSSSASSQNGGDQSEAAATEQSAEEMAANSSAARSSIVRQFRDALAAG